LARLLEDPGTLRVPPNRATHVWVHCGGTPARPWLARRTRFWMGVKRLLDAPACGLRGCHATHPNSPRARLGGTLGGSRAGRARLGGTRGWLLRPAVLDVADRLWQDWGGS